MTIKVEVTRRGVGSADDDPRFLYPLHVEVPWPLPVPATSPPDPRDLPKVTISVEQKVVTEQYGGSAGSSIILSGLTVHTSDEEMEALLDTGKVAYAKMTERIRERVHDIRTRHGV